jgi:uncharacterized protein (DUF4415 family)
MKKKNKRVKLDTDEAPEWTQAMFKKAKRGKAALEEIFGKENAEALVARKVGRPRVEHPKKPISFRFDAELVAHLRGEVAGYNGRVESLLLQAMQEGRL